MGSPEINELFERVAAIANRLSQLSADDPRRTALETEREALRNRVDRLSMTGRHPTSVEREIAAIEARLDEISAMTITEGYQERRGGRNLQDPSAYSANINKLLTAQHAEEVDELTRRLDRLRGGSGDDGGR